VKYLKKLKWLYIIIITNLCYGCVGGNIKSSDTVEDEQYTIEDDLKYDPMGNHPTKVVPLFSKKVIFSDEEQEDKK
jgi:hypothetical protein